MATAAIGTIGISAPGPTVAKREATITLNGGNSVIKDITTDPTFACNVGDAYKIRARDTDAAGSVSDWSNELDGTAQTPPPPVPTLTGVGFRLA